MKVVTHLKAARVLITPEGSWCMDSRHNGQDQRCLLGALDAINSETRYAANKELYKTLQERFLAGNFPTTMHRTGGHGDFVDWRQRLSGEYSTDHPLAQFNNTTSQEQVLKLFDETIARLEGAVPAPTEPVKQEPKPEPVKVPERVLELV